jgi:hypothetical protein
MNGIILLYAYFERITRKLRNFPSGINTKKDTDRFSTFDYMGVPLPFPARFFVRLGSGR